MFISHTPKKELTVKQRSFLRELPKDFNATQAAIRAGYSAKTAAAAASRLMKLLCRHVKQLVNMSASESLTPSSAHTIDRFLLELERLAYFDPRKLFDAHGNPIEISALSDAEAPCIAGFEFYEDFGGKGESRRAIGYTRKFKLTDKISALALLGKIRGFYNVPQDPPSSPVNVHLAVTLTPEEAYLKMVRGK